MDLLVSILTGFGYLFDKVINFFKGWPDWLYLLIYLSYGYSILQKHIDERMDRIERRLDALQRPDYE